MKGKRARLPSPRWLVSALVVLSLATVALAGSWLTKASMPAAERFPAVESVNGILYAAGGLDVNNNPSAALQAYNAATDSWGTLASMPAVRYDGDGAGVINGLLYVPGGWTNSPPLPNDTLFVYDPVANSWTSKATMPQLSGCGASGVINGKLYVTTPCNGFSGYFNILDVYDPNSDTWTALANSNTAQANSAYGVINGKLYVAGGMNPTLTNVLEVYDPVANTWTNLAPIPFPVTNPGSVVSCGKLYVVGGRSGVNETTIVSRVQVYNPATNKWTRAAALPTVRADLGAGNVNCIIYAVGGTSTSDNLALNTNQSLQACP